MDSFDDLLTPSRRPFEENPFEDPFGKRSGSPDPWASPFAQPDVEQEHNAFADDDTHASFSGQPFGGDEYQPFSGHNDNDYTYDDQTRAEENHERDSSDKASTKDEDDEPSRSPVSTPKADPTPRADPLDSVNLAKSEPSSPERSAPIRSPGFLQDIPANYSEVDTIRPAALEDETKIALPSQNVARSISESSMQSRARVSVSPMPSVSKSPLDMHGSMLESSFPGLSIGGESLSGGGLGWQPAPPPKPQDDDDDSEDDRPIGETAARLAQQKSPPITPRKPDANEDAVFVISVDDPQKVGDLTRSFTLYTVHTRTTSTAFQKSAFSVLRRYSDFLWLYETLAYNNPGVVIPPVPEKNTFGRFDDQFVKHRRSGLEKCIQKIANHSVLNKDPDFKLFLEGDNFALEIKHRAKPQSGFISSIGQSIAGPRFHETDDWFDRQKSYLDNLESQLRSLVKAIEFVSKQRQELAVATREHMETLSSLALSDIGDSLAASISGLAEVEQKAQELLDSQSQQDLVVFMATVDEYARLINSVRLAFTSRIRIYHAWRAADADVGRVKQNHERSRAQGRIPPDRMGYSLNQVAEAERRALEAKHEYDHCSKLVKSEMARFEKERIDDFKDSLHAFLEGMISRQKELLEHWERYQHTLLQKAGGPKEQAGGQNGESASTSQEVEED